MEKQKLWKNKQTGEILNLFDAWAQFILLDIDEYTTFDDIFEGVQ